MRALNRLFEQFFERTSLAEHGFELKKTASAERICDGAILQILGFRPSGKRPEFAYEVGWRFINHPLEDDTTIDSLLRLGQIVGNRDDFFGLQPESGIDNTLDYLVNATRDRVLPFLDTVCGAEALLAAFEKGEIRQDWAFGSDAGWNAYHRGICLRAVGRVKEAADCFRVVVEDLSSERHEIPFVAKLHDASQRLYRELEELE